MPSPDLMFALSGALAVIFAVVVFIVWKKSRITPEERERRRRASLAAWGKMGDATLVEMTGAMVFYAYSVGGVEYTACQDVSHLAELIPADLSEVASVGIKYNPRNPANSIVIAEQWSGLRVRKTG